MTGIVDAHHHIWRQADLPWLVGPMQPRIFGPYEPIRRDYPIREYLDDLSGNGVVKSVYVQTNWAKERFEDETAWVQRTSEETGWPHAIVAYADFSADDVRPQLDRLKRYPLVRGVRMQLHWHENPLYRFAAHGDLCADPAIRRNVARLADYGWSFDLQVFAPRCRARPGLPKPVRRSPSCCSMPECWRICRPPAAPPGAPAWCGWRRVRTSSASSRGSAPSFIATTLRMSPRIVAEALAIFGPDRCLFGSNFPIEKLWTDYRALVDAYLDAVKSNPSHRDAIMRDTAMRVYRIAP